MASPTPTQSPAPPQPSPPRRRAVGARLAVAAVTLLVALGLAEAALAVWTSRATPALYRLDDRLGWTHAPRVDRLVAVEGGGTARFCTDARGLRATPHADARPAGRRRVLFVGDSFTEGSQVADDELFSRRLERELPGVECWNAGVGGYSTVQVLLALPDQLAAWQPDVVVLTVYDNDLQDNLMPYFAGLGPRPCAQLDGGVVRVVPQPPAGTFERFLMPAPGALWLYEHSALYRTLHKHLWLPSRANALHALEGAERAALPLADQRTAMAQLLRQLAAAVRAQGAKLVVAAIPTREQAKAGTCELHDWLAAQCLDVQAPFRSLLPELARAGAANAYFAFDIHLTATGHAAVAEGLLSILREAVK
ncbi:MAG: SGNH/GDSL hydrolase family protein [Planctomycetota bacterium]